MKELEANVKAIELDGLVWGGSKLVAVGFGIKKLQINVVVEDDKVSIDDLQAKIEEDEDHVQSTDVSFPILTSRNGYMLDANVIFSHLGRRHAKALNVSFPYD